MSYGYCSWCETTECSYCVRGAPHTCPPNYEAKYEALRTACEALLAANDRFDRVDAMQAIRELLK